MKLCGRCDIVLACCACAFQQTNQLLFLEATQWEDNNLELFCGLEHAEDKRLCNQSARIFGRQTVPSIEVFSFAKISGFSGENWRNIFDSISWDNFSTDNVFKNSGRFDKASRTTCNQLYLEWQSFHFSWLFWNESRRFQVGNKLPLTDCCRRQMLHSMSIRCDKHLNGRQGPVSFFLSLRSFKNHEGSCSRWLLLSFAILWFSYAIRGRGEGLWRRVKSFQHTPNICNVDCDSRFKKIDRLKLD